MARIVVLNNHDLRVAWEDVAKGESPDQFLYGLNHFERAGHSVTIVPYEHSRALHRASQALMRSPVRLGDLDQQASVLRVARRADLIYCPSQNVAQVLCYLRALGIVRCPIVWLVHHPLDTGRLSRPRRPLMRMMLRGLDAYPALSTTVAHDCAELAGSAARTGAPRWGPDPDWYPRLDGAGRGVVAAGRTKRDFTTFAQAAAQTDVPAWIVGATDPPRVRAPNLQVIERLPYRDLVELYAQARAIAVPLHVRWPWTINGILVLMEALAVGKPLIVTRNPWIDLDIERLGIGIWVAAGDVRGWRDAIRHLDEHPDEAQAMGRRARALVDSGERSSATFANDMLEICDRVLSASA